MQACSSGAVVLAYTRTLREMLGDATYEAALGTLPSEARAALEYPDGLSWVPLAWVYQLVDALARATQQDADRLYERTIEANVQRLVQGAWRSFIVRFLPDSVLISQATRLYARARNVGRCEVRLDGSGRASGSIRDWPGIQRRDVLALMVSIRALLSNVGRKNVRVDYVRRQDGADFRIAWEA
jgi:hypothetical protein